MAGRKKNAEVMLDGYIVRDAAKSPTAARDLAEHIAVELRNRHCGYPDVPARTATAEERAAMEAMGKPRRRKSEIAAALDGTP